MSNPTAEALVEAGAEAEYYDSSDRKAVGKAVQRAKNKDERMQEALRGIMQMPEGRAWVKTVLERCAPFSTSFSTDPIQMAFNCGRTDIGLQLIAEIHACSTELYLVMMKENPND